MTRDSFTPKGWQLVCTVLLLRALATAIAAGTGFTAVSDDDFARVVIAQSFAEQPRWDPSGSSWLPFPFWLNGIAMLGFGPHLWVARAVALVSSLASSALVYVAGRWCGLGRPAAWLGASIAAVLPHAVWLGYATVPEGLSAAMSLLGVASVAQVSLSRRVLGGSLLLCATLSRYEAWPLAAAVAAFHCLDAVRERRPALFAVALLCCAGPLAWVLHGWMHHGDPWFFVARVADYRRQLGRSPSSLLDTLLGYPVALLRGEPELTAMAILTWLSAHIVSVTHPAAKGTPKLRAPTGLRRLLLALSALLLFLVVGDVRDGAPTHHPERPLLACWLGLCLFTADALIRLSSRRRLLLGFALLAVGVSVARPLFTRRDAFVDRSAELDFGRRVAQSLDPQERLLIDVGDYGYFAVIAGFERPSLAMGLADGDPRQARHTFDSAVARLRFWAERARAEHVVVRAEGVSELRTLGQPVFEDGRYALLRIQAAAP